MKQVSARGRIAAILTAAVLAAVLLLNILISFLCDRFRVITDLTAEGLYTVDGIYLTLLDETFASLRAEREQAGEVPATVDILFCDDPDVLVESDTLRYIYYTALSLQKRYPDFIRVRCVDIWKNPSAVQAYKANSASSIYASNVIVSSGTEYRVYSPAAFYYFDSNDYAQKKPIGYSGDKTFTKAILSVTMAEAPVCCLISNHGEQYSDTFVDLLSDAGYRVIRDFDLRRDEIPKDCRMMISAGPVTDFYAVFGDTEPDGDDEIDKLDGFLDRINSFLFFFDPSTPYLPVLEEYLAEWGISVDRHEGEAFRVSDTEPGYALNADGTALVGQYASGGLGASLISEMTDAGNPKKTLFPDCGSISRPANYYTGYSEADEETGTPAFRYGYYSSNGVNRSNFEFFHAGENAVATAGDLVSNTGSNTLMSVTVEYHLIAEDKGYTWATEASYVVACASTAFLSDEALGSSYGNTDVLLSTLRTMGRETVAADNSYRFFHTSELGSVQSVPDADKKQITVWLAVLPAVLLAGACVIVMVRRKNKA